MLWAFRRCLERCNEAAEAEASRARVGDIWGFEIYSFKAWLDLLGEYTILNGYRDTDKICRISDLAGRGFTMMVCR
jgi:hypothetical protein